MKHKAQNEEIVFTKYLQKVQSLPNITSGILMSFLKLRFNSWSEISFHCENKRVW